MGFSDTQKVALAVIPKFTAFLSIAADSLIAIETLKLDRTKLRRVYHRLVLTMALFDLSVASAKFLSTWPIPKDGETDTWAASGNDQTCVAQGFFLQLGIGAVATNCCLACYFLLVIRFSWSEDRIRRKAEPAFYAVAGSIALGTAVAGLCLDLYNPANLWCWIAKAPKGCDESFQNGGESTCARGDNAGLYRWAFYYVIIWFTIVFATGVMVALYASFRRLDRANLKYMHAKSKRNILNTCSQSSSLGLVGCDADVDIDESSPPGSSRHLPPTGTGAATSTRPTRSSSQSRKVAIQGIWYIGAFYLTWFFATVNRIYQLATDESVYGLAVMHALLSPSQGFWNYLVYVRPRFLKYRAAHPEATLWRSVRCVMFHDYGRYARGGEREVDVDGARREMGRFSFGFGPVRLWSKRSTSRMSSVHDEPENNSIKMEEEVVHRHDEEEAEQRVEVDHEEAEWEGAEMECEEGEAGKAHRKVSFAVDTREQGGGEESEDVQPGAA